MYNVGDKVLYRGIMAEILNPEICIDEFLDVNSPLKDSFTEQNFMKIKSVHFPEIKLVVTENELAPHDGNFINDLSRVYGIVLDFDLMKYLPVEQFLKNVYKVLEVYFDMKCKELLSYDIILTKKELVTIMILSNEDIINGFTAMKIPDFFVLNEEDSQVLTDFLETSIAFETNMFKKYKKYLDKTK